MKRTAVIGEYRQSDGWHIAQPFDTPTEAREWANRVDESEGHHHARRWRRVRINSSAYRRALYIAFHAYMEAAFEAALRAVTHHDQDWDNDSLARCQHCNHIGMVGEYDVNED